MTRSKHEGSFSQRKDGKWQGQITIDRKRHSVYGMTRKEANEKVKVLINNYLSGIKTKPTDYTVSEWADIWLRDCIRLEVRPNTYLQILQVVTGHVKPTVGTVSLQKLRVSHVQDMVRTKLDSGLSPATVKKIRNALHAIVEYAVKLELLIRNPVKLVSIKNVQRPEIKVLTKVQLQQFLEEAKSHFLYPAILLLATTGVRRSEACGIKWSDINWDENTVCIQRVVVKCGGYNILIHDTKTSGSRRLIPIPPILLNVLKAHKDTHGAQEYLFSRSNGQPIYPESIYDSMKVLGKRIGVPAITVHMLRHTAASLLLEAGENPKIVQELMGHSSISVTMDIYSHVIPGMKLQAINKLSSMITQGAVQIDVQTPISSL